MHPDTLRRLEEMDKHRKGTGSSMEEMMKAISSMRPKDREKPKLCTGCGRDGDDL